MSANVEVQFEDGTKLYVGGSKTATGLQEVSLSANAEKIAKEKFEKALGSLAHLVDALGTSLAKVSKKPKSVEMEFGASLTTECDLWIVSGEGTAEFKVKLTWE